MQCLQSVPTVAVDKTDGCTIYFPRSCLETIRILTSKCSDMNVSFPSAEDEQDWVGCLIEVLYRLNALFLNNTCILLKAIKLRLTFLICILLKIFVCFMTFDWL